VTLGAPTFFGAGRACINVHIWEEGKVIVMRNSLRILFALALVLLAGTASAQNFTATIDALQETPPNASPATGSATLVLNTAANTLSYNIVYSGLTAAETAAHIHGFAAPGVPAGVLHPLPAANPKIGVWNYMEAQEASILAGLTYINIHTTAFPGGEIRGQILREVVGVETGTWGKVKSLFN
jgi:hypothetical protein